MLQVPRPGDRVRMVEMVDDPDPIGAGELGTVRSVVRIGCGWDEWHQVSVAWDSGRSLMLSIPPDRIEVLEGLTINLETKQTKA